MLATAHQLADNVKEKQEKALAGPIAAAVPVKEAPPKPENISGYRPYRSVQPGDCYVLAAD